MARRTKIKKNPWVAAILNLFLLGLGYVYVGKRVAFGVGLVLWSVTIMAWYYSIPAPSASDPSIFAFIQLQTLVLADSLILGILFAYDGYKTAEGINGEPAKS
jgi:hypothetical protein